VKKVVFAVLLVACFVGVALAADSHTNPASVARPDVVSGAPIAVHPFVNVAAMLAPGIKIFVSDALNSIVDIYNPSGKLLGQLAGLSEPQGIAADSKGNLYVADTVNSRIQIYAPPYNKKPKTLNDPGQYPVGVSVLNKGEFVAVMNISSTTGGPSSIVLYKNGKAVKTISSPSSRVYFGAFDGNGNLYVDGEDSNGEVVLGEIAKLTTSGKILSSLTYTGTILFPGGIEVTTAGKIAIGDQEAGTIYTFKQPKKGSLGSPVDTTPLTGSGDAATFAFTKSNKDLWIADAINGAAKYAYPAGGNPLKIFSIPGAEPIGVALVPAAVPGK
jgi:hypothetical protein